MHERAASRSRLISIVAAVFIALACGTNYAYSTWGPQFAERLKLSSTESNLIGSFGNLGMYIPAIPVGIMVDSKGPKLAVAGGAFLLGIGYMAIYLAFESGPGSFHVATICFFSFLTGCGSCAAFLAALKTAAINYPDNRGTATGLPLAGYGLSAFLFSTISELAFSDDTSKFLLVLAIVTFVLNSISFFFVRWLPPGSKNSKPTYGPSDSQVLRRTKSHDGEHHAIANNDLEETSEGWKSADVSTRQDGYNPDPEDANMGTHESSSLLSKSSESEPEEFGFQPRSKEERMENTDIRGLALLVEAQFWQLFFMFGLLAGIGLMNINNIGNDVQALWRYHDESASPVFIANQQSMHVSILSVASCGGRLLSGAGSDLLVKRLKMNRMWCLFASALVFTAAQFSALQIENPNYLALVSGLTGVAYGVLYGFFPSLLAQRFGINGMSQNWGTLILAPVISGNLFNIMYGEIYDKHSVLLPDGERECLEGFSCYWTASLVTLLAGLLATVLSLASIWRENKLWRQENVAQQRSNHES